MPATRQRPELPARPINPERPHDRSLEDDIRYVRNVGPSGAEILAKLGIRTAGDVLRHVPRRYEDRTRFRRIAELSHGEFATVQGQVVAAANTATNRKNFTLTKVMLDDGSAVAQLVFFQQPYLLRQFQQLQRDGRWVVVYGQAKRGGYGPVEIERAEWEALTEEGDILSTNRIVPIYPATEGINQRRLRKIAHTVLESYLGLVQETLPAEIVRQHRLMNPRAALRNVHFPDDFATLEQARRRLIFEEFFLLQVMLAQRRARRGKEAVGLRFAISHERLDADLRRILPFELTQAQRAAIEDIASDLQSGRAMNRLLQGDVGSGKTVVALAALLMAVENGYQAALMAPTEILAQQHAIVLRRMLEPVEIPVVLCLGRHSAKKKESIAAEIASGEAPVVVGTHALIQENVQFKNLGLAIIDEQHRFGVLQRQALHKKGATPHVLVMTATPIPRTLTMTLYGDLDTSFIRELPPGRKPIKTHWKPRGEAKSAYAAADKLLEQGRQAYIVCPLVEESEKLQAKAATQLAEHIQTDVYPHRRVGLLHGQMRAEEKDAVMRRFQAHELDVLVATTVIEVGIDVPNASVMIIEDADRFGLAQLHQLRGRVGRGEHPSYCVLLADPKTEEGRIRMEVMTETCDGFRIAEADLQLRGPGEILGTRQSGLPELYIGDLLHDSALMEEARKAAFTLVANDPDLIQPEHAALREALARGRMGFELAHVS